MTLGSEIRAPAVVRADEVFRKDIHVQLVDPLAVDGAQYGTVGLHMNAASVKRLKERSRLKTNSRKSTKVSIAQHVSKCSLGDINKEFS